MYTILNPMGASMSNHVPSALRGMLSSNFEARAFVGGSHINVSNTVVFY
jgi:hypothetical protein